MLELASYWTLASSKPFSVARVSEVGLALAALAAAKLSVPLYLILLPLMVFSLSAAVGFATGYRGGRATGLASVDTSLIWATLLAMCFGIQNMLR